MQGGADERLGELRDGVVHMHEDTETQNTTGSQNSSQKLGYVPILLLNGVSFEVNIPTTYMHLENS